jgi:hypothetical protein
MTVNVSETLLSPFAKGFAALEHRCPDYFDVPSWQQGVDDGRRFLGQWGGQAEALGWTVDDLFGLYDPPERTGPRLSRYDVTGLIWFLHGRSVVALTADIAVIGAAGGATFYRRQSKASPRPASSS